MPMMALTVNYHVGHRCINITEALTMLRAEMTAFTTNYNTKHVICFSYGSWTINPFNLNSHNRDRKKNYSSKALKMWINHQYM